MRPLLRSLIAAALCALQVSGALAATAQEPDSDPVTLIAAIYKTYKSDSPGLPQMYSKRLQALIDKDASETPEGMVGRIDWDVFVDGQDWQIKKLHISLVSKTDDTATVRASFLNFDKQCNLLFDLVLEDGRWRIDEIQETEKPRWIMSKILADEPGAMPDAPPSDTPAPEGSGERRIELH